MSEFIKHLKKRLKTCLLLMTGLLLSISVFAQQITVTGTVIDNTGETLPGVNVMIKGTSQGTVTDVDGKFRVNVPDENSVLQVSFVGFNAQEFVVGDRREIDVTLFESATSLDEVVVIGYSSQIRANLTGSVGSISGAALERVPVASAAEALVGKVAGVQVTTTDGAPGSEVNIRIRGGTSVTQSNEPLFIVDGFPAKNINDIPPTDIQSIDILKDASLTAIYGARGGNGVVIVTTKAAKAGKLTVNFNHTTQVRTLARKLDLMAPYEFVWMQQELAINNYEKPFRKDFGNPADFDLYKRYGKGNDWQDEILGGKPLSFMYNLTVGGGSEKLRFNTSVTHNDEQGVLVGSGVMRTNMNTKINAEILPNLKLLINPRFSYRRNMGAGADAVGGGGIIDVLRYRPTNGLREYSWVAPEDLDPVDEASFQYTNPKGDIEQNYKRDNIYELINQASIEWGIIKGLTFRSEGSLSIMWGDYNRFQGWITKEGRNNNNRPVADIENRKRNTYTWTNTLNYIFSLGNNNISILAGQEIYHQEEQRTALAARYFPQNISPTVALLHMQMGKPWKTTSSITSPERIASFFGQIGYNFDSRYLLSLTMRADGSTKFGPGNQWGYFPAVSGGWVISKEKFMENVSLISFLKIRGAIGMSGNNRIPDDMWRYQYVISSDNGPGWGEESDTGYEFYVNSGGGTFPNSKIRWETTLTRTAALDINLFNDRLSLVPEVYWNTTFDLLYQSGVSPEWGYSQQMQNIGQVTNRGWDLTLNASIIEKKSFFLRGFLTFGANKTRVDKLNGVEDVLWTTSNRWKSSDNDYCVKVGDQLGLIYGYVYDGLYQFDDFTEPDRNNFFIKPGVANAKGLLSDDNVAPGKPKFKKFAEVENEEDPDLINEKDRVVIGNTNPKFSGGFGFQGGWKSFDFNINFTYIYKFDVNNATRFTLSSSENNRNNWYNASSEFSRDRRWRYTNDTGHSMYRSNSDDYPFYDEYREINAGATIFNPRDIPRKLTFDYFIEEGSFLRLQDVTIGYTLPKTLTRKVGVERLRVYFSGYNLWLWTNYSGFDPEVDIQSGLTPGVDYNRYPRSRNFVFGLNLGF